MHTQKTSATASSAMLTQHAMLVAWGVYAQQMGLVEAVAQVKLSQKTREHRPQTKVLEFFVAILAGLSHLHELSRSAHPIDKDKAVAEAWGQAAWADYSGVSRALQSLNGEEVQAIADGLNAVSQPFIDQETDRAVEASGRLVYDADLTGGCPLGAVSNTSTTYPKYSLWLYGGHNSFGLPSGASQHA